jgi:tetratricopeptide (TPR) repeat protein
MQIHINLADIFAHQGAYDQSIAEISEVIKHQPNAQIQWNWRSALKLAKGDLSGARADVEKALSLKPDFVEAQQILAAIVSEENKAKQSIITPAAPIQKVVVAPVARPLLQPAFADIVKEFKTCEIFEIKYNYDPCTQVISNPQQSTVSKALAYYQRASGLAAENRYIEALMDSDQAIKLNPNLAIAYEFRSYIHGKQREFDKSIVDADTAIKIDPNNSDSYRYRAIAKLALGNIAEARRDIEKALELKSDDVEAKQALAEIAVAENKSKQAAVVPPVTEKVVIVPDKKVQEAVVIAAPPPQKPALVQKRVALVIGNSAYSDGMALVNPTNDAKAVAASLRRLGFNVVLATDATKIAMTDAMYRFAVLSDSADAALVFYAGHGMQVDGVNYLMPVDASLETRADLKHKFVSADEILDDLRSVKGMRMMVLDACRNNPLSRSIKLKLAKLTSRAVDNRDGLADMKAEGVLIAFATQPNEVAADGDGADSPFTLALLQHLETPNIEIDTMFKRVRTTVSQMTEGAQLPQTVNSSTGEFYLKSK